MWRVYEVKVQGTVSIPALILSFIRRFTWYSLTSVVHVVVLITTICVELYQVKSGLSPMSILMPSPFAWNLLF